jgi:hypothetical protein
LLPPVFFPPAASNHASKALLATAALQNRSRRNWQNPGTIRRDIPKLVVHNDTVELLDQASPCRGRAAGADSGMLLCRRKTRHGKDLFFLLTPLIFRTILRHGYLVFLTLLDHLRKVRRGIEVGANHLQFNDNRDWNAGGDNLNRYR